MENFEISFQWQSQDRQLQIRTLPDSSHEVAISVYQVFRNNIYLFSVYPVITASSDKSWEIVEKDREEHMPEGFIDFLGRRIDWHYRMN